MLFIHFKTIAVFIFLVLSIVGTGGLFKPLYKLNGGIVEKFWWRSIIGTGILGTILFFIGYFYWSILWILPLIIILALIGAYQIAIYKLSLLKALNRWVRLPGSWIVVVSLGLFFITGLAHPSGDIGHDGIAYHLLAPVKWPFIGKIVSLPEHSHTAFPFLIETFFGVSALFGAIEASGVLGVLFSAQLMGCVWFLARDLGAEEKSRSFIVGIAATMPVLISTTDDYYIDIPFAVFALSMLRVLAKSRDLSSIVLAGILAGAAGATKYTGLFIIFSGLLLIIYQHHQERFKKTMVSVMSFLLVAGLLTIPWYLRNLVEYNSPIIPPPPFLYKLLPATGWPDVISEAFHQRITEEVGAGFGKSILDFILLPFNFTFFPGQFRGAHGTFFTFFFTPLALWKLRSNKVALTYLAWAFFITLIWFFTQQNARFLIHVTALFTAFCSLSYRGMAFHKNLLIKSLSIVFIAITLAIGVVGFVKHRSDRFLSVFSKQISDTRMKNKIPFYEAIEYVNSHQEVEKILLLSKWVPGFYVSKPYIKTVGHYGNRPFPDIESPKETLEQLDKWKCTHVIDTKNDNWLVDPADPRMKLVLESEGARVFEILNP